MSDQIVMVAWCNRDGCDDILDREFRRLAVNETPESRPVIAFVSSIKEIKEILESNDMFSLGFFEPPIIVDSEVVNEPNVEHESIIDILNEIAALFGTSISNKKFIKGIAWGDALQAAAIEAAGFTAI